MLILTMWVKSRFTSPFRLRHPLFWPHSHNGRVCGHPCLLIEFEVHSLFNPIDTACNFATIVTNKFKIRMKGSKVWSQESSIIGFSVVLVCPHFMFYRVLVPWQRWGLPSSWMSDLTLAFLCRSTFITLFWVRLHEQTTTVVLKKSHLTPNSLGQWSYP
jgi:hypothetical protein